VVYQGVYGTASVYTNKSDRETTNTSLARYKVNNAQPTWIEIQLTGVESRAVDSVFTNLCPVCWISVKTREMSRFKAA